MQDYKAFFTGKKITVVGLGLLGRGLGDIAFLAECGAEVTVTDLKTREQLKESFDTLAKYSNIRFVLGEHRLEDFRDRDMVLKAPKMPLNSPYVVEAKKSGAHVTMSAALFVRLAEIPIIGVTGTRGKTTTTYMIAEALKRDGRNVLVGGNVQGVSTLSLLPTVQSDSVAVLELDSWQLQGFREEKISPQIAVFTTFYPDHMDYYGGNMDLYLADKAEIFLHQDESDTLIAGEQALPAIKRKYGSRVRSKVVKAGLRSLPVSWKLQIPGDHNRYNAGCALEALRAFGADDEVTREAFEGFKAVPGRLEFVREVRGIRIYNDTTSTTPEAAIAGIKALDSGKRNVILIMGGSDKNLDMTELWKEIQSRCKALYFLAGSGIDRIRHEAPHVPIYQSLKEVLDAALAGANPGDTILFSPALASFGMFKNEYDRGDQFMSLVQSFAQ